MRDVDWSAGDVHGTPFSSMIISWDQKEILRMPDWEVYMYLFPFCLNSVSSFSSFLLLPIIPTQTDLPKTNIKYLKPFSTSLPEYLFTFPPTPIQWDRTIHSNPTTFHCIHSSCPRYRVSIRCFEFASYLFD